MSAYECEFESEVLALTLQGRWPDGAEPELREHARECAICSDAAAIAGAMEDARQESYAAAAPADSGRVWRQAQLRARLEAAEAANRPMAAAQVLALVCAVVVLTVSLRASAAWLGGALDRFATAASGLDLGAWLAPAAKLAGEHVALAVAAAAVLCVIPAAAYLAMGRD